MAGTLAGNLYLQRRFALQQRTEDAITVLTVEQVTSALRAYIDPAKWVWVFAGDFKP